MTMIINFIQDVATPHNNSLLKALNKRNGLQLNIWYAYDKAEKYNWKKDLTNEIKKARIFGFDQINWGFIKYVLTHKDEKYFIVGWSNHTMRILVPLMWISRRPYNMWFDMPQDDRDRSRVQAALRNLFYFMLKYSHARVFCVGKMTVAYFRTRGFQANRLVNLPIFVDISKTKKDYEDKKEDIFSKYKIKDNDLFLTAGSRLIFDKGFDLLIKALNLLKDETKKRIKLLIVGRGEEKDNLINLVNEYGLGENIVWEDWMDIDSFRACIASSDVFIHPARFDAFGGGTLNSMPVGTPVIGTNQSGSSFDRIRDGENGWLYDCNDIEKLAAIIENCYSNNGALKAAGLEARKTAEEWIPETGADILSENIV